MTLYKSLTIEHKGPYSVFDFTPYLPHDGKPGKWLPKRTDISMCESGWHYCEGGDIIGFLNAEIYEVEVKGKVIRDTSKCAAEQMRLVRKVEGWNERTARLFACDCAERVLPIFEKEYPDDKHPRKAIETARLFADGKATLEELNAAADAAADAAAYAAYAAYAADAAYAAYAAYAADAARAAADAARAAERKEQVAILLKYLEG